MTTVYRTLPARVEPAKFATTLHFAYPSPPVTANQRLHWRAKAKLTAQIRADAARLAAHIPELGKCRVTLTWIVTTSHRRDADNIVPTLKGICDGLVDAGIVRDDTPDLMDKLMPRIVQVPKTEGPPHMELRIEQL